MFSGTVTYVGAKASAGAYLTARDSLRLFLAANSLGGWAGMPLECSLFTLATSLHSEKCDYEEEREGVPEKKIKLQEGEEQQQHLDGGDAV